MLLKKAALAVVVIIVVFSSILTGCNTGTATSSPTATTVPVKTLYQQTADNLKAIQPAEVPANLIPADGLKSGTEFDVNSIFKVLTHLSMQEGYVLDYVFLSDGSQGGPIIYTRAVSSTPFQTYNEYRQATHDFPRPANDFSMIWLVKGAGTSVFGNKVKTDGTAEGYYEYALFQGLANQFYLLGRAQYNDKRVVAESSEMESILADIKNSENWTQADNDFKKAARVLELEPVIKVSDTNVLVQMVLFTKWGGFLRYSLLVNRDYPHTVISSALETVLPYDCGLKL